MPSSPLKRPSPGGRLRRLLASLRPPAKAGPLPVQTGFPTSLADLVVKNHGRFQNTRRRHRAAAPAAEPVPQQRRELSLAQEEAAAAAPSPARPNGTAAFSIRSEVLAVGGAVALALLVIWSKLLVAAATAASVALLWIESARARASPRHGRAEEEEEVVGLLRGGRVSPIREAAEPSPGPSSAEPEVDTRSEQDADGSDLDPSVTPPRTEKRRRRSLRKLLAKKLRNGARRRVTDSRHGGESEQRPGAGEVNAGAGAVQTGLGPAQEDTTPPLEAAVDDERCQRRRWGGALPLVAALVPIVLVGLVAGKLPAVALTVLCGVFSSSSVDRAPDPAPITASA